MNDQDPRAMNPDPLMRCDQCDGTFHLSEATGCLCPICESSTNWSVDTRPETEQVAASRRESAPVPSPQDPTVISQRMARELLRTLTFAAHKHARQRRKDIHATPYINHPIAVAELLARAGCVTDLITLQAALLHDTIEDTATTPEEIENAFGREIRLLVWELTDDKSLPQQDRKRLQIEHAPHLSPRARLIKLADKICNVTDFTADSPVGWSIARRRQYLAWAAQVVNGLRGTHQVLEAMFDKTLAEKQRLLAQQGNV